MKLAPQLKPFWFVPSFQAEGDKVRFKLRPLTQSEMIEVESLYTVPDEPRSLPRWNISAQFHAAMLSIQECDGIVDENDAPVRWPFGIDRPDSQDLRNLICQAGQRIIVEMNGGDWDLMVKGVPALPQQPAEDDPAKT